jgi:hypothetical protein
MNRRRHPVEYEDVRDKKGNKYGRQAISRRRRRRRELEQRFGIRTGRQWIRLRRAIQRGEVR